MTVVLGKIVCLGLGECPGDKLQCVPLSFNDSYIVITIIEIQVVFLRK